MEVRNRFKGLDLIDRVPDELCNEVRDIAQETGWGPLSRAPRDSLSEATFDAKNNICCINKHLIIVSTVSIITIN